VRVSGVEELEAADEHGDGGPPALENALRKARAVAAGEQATVIGCDTVVVLDGRVYGKPRDAAQARRTLGALAGRTHEVTSGLAVLVGGEERTAIARTQVSFRALEGRLIDWYVARGEWRERAGGYAIQGAGAVLVRSLTGEYENVVGLPLAALLDIYPELLEA
jgi:septum formation protein